MGGWLVRGRTSSDCRDLFEEICAVNKRNDKEESGHDAVFEAVATTNAVTLAHQVPKERGTRGGGRGEATW